MKSKNWTFLLSLDTVSFRKSQIYVTHSLYAEPSSPFLQTLQIHVQSEKAQIFLGRSGDLFPKSIAGLWNCSNDSGAERAMIHSAVTGAAQSS